MNTKYTVGIIVVILLAVGAFAWDRRVPETALPAEAKKETISQTPVATPAAPKAKSTGAPKAPVANQTPTLPAGIALIAYTDQGFVPSPLHIKRGTTVRFLNQGSNALRVISQDTSIYSKLMYRGLDMSVSIKRGEYYEMSFTDVGVWPYKNLNAQSHVGVIIVE